MEEYAYGPVELLLISFDGDRPGPALRQALLDLIEERTVTLLDLIFVNRTVDGEVLIVEIDDLPEKTQLPDLDLGELGLAGIDDVEELAMQLEPGTSAAVLVVELTWARHFASVLAASGARSCIRSASPPPW
ncbi:DUF6325 family protein [Cryobacterium sp. PAMC25264]|uniref:DUF6325 family protein n=1 Tax=Cryobacterium sp. PAMC25264 TaxID=2861288 RepID=UPI001C633657|nr:DUF6325 family protein [Cryobacterium sp. PAMC25264]QYF75000.1 hypothetical protein KY500_07810 [Cryobacterium sp. PAMC25264]